MLLNGDDLLKKLTNVKKARLGNLGTGALGGPKSHCVITTGPSLSLKMPMSDMSEIRRLEGGPLGDTFT